MDMPTEDNLPYVLQTAINRPTAVCFHIINNVELLNRLAQLVAQFERNEDEPGLRFLSRIVRTILNYHDTRIIEVLFGSSFFETMLRVLKRTSTSYEDSEAN